MLMLHSQSLENWKAEGSIQSRGVHCPQQAVLGSQRQRVQDGLKFVDQNQVLKLTRLPSTPCPRQPVARSPRLNAQGGPRLRLAKSKLFAGAPVIPRFED